MADAVTELPNSPRWLHRWAVLTAGATLALLLLGSLVTTTKSGMADPDWPTAPWHLIVLVFTAPQQLTTSYVIEHSHRLGGYVVGICVIVLAAGLWLREPRSWVRRLGYFALLGVVVQGLLGGFRVKLNDILGTDLAIVHGCFAPLVFTALVSVAASTGLSWSRPAPTADAIGRLRRALAISTGLIYLQIVLGVLLRQTYSNLWPRAHLLVAFAVVGMVGWVAKEARDRHATDKGLRRTITMLMSLVGIQILLGIEALMTRFLGSGSVGRQLGVRTAHVIVGASILAAAVVATQQAYRRQAKDSGATRMEGDPEQTLATAGEVAR